MRIVGVFNRDGGTFKDMDMAALCAEAEAAFAAEGHEFSCDAVPGPDLVEALEKAATTAGVEAIVAGGGDGTISAAAGIAFEHGVALGVIPAGTMNLFARSLAMPLDVSGAILALAAGHVTEVDIATANGRPFVHQFAVGFHPRLVRVREEFEYRNRWEKIAASFRAVRSIVEKPPRFTVEIVGVEGLGAVKVSGLTIANNRFADGPFPHAEHLDRGELGVYVVRSMPSWSMMRLTIGLIFGSWKGHEDVTETAVPRVVLRFPQLQRSAEAIVDGELIPLEREVELLSHPGGLKIIAPAEAETAA